MATNLVTMLTILVIIQNLGFCLAVAVYLRYLYYQIIIAPTFIVNNYGIIFACFPVTRPLAGTLVGKGTPLSERFDQRLGNSTTRGNYSYL